MAAWIATIGDEEASPELTACFDAVRAPSGDVGNVMRVHSLRPHTMTGHQALHMSVLHHHGNRLPAWFQEVIASWVSILNRCDYSVVNHFANARHLIEDEYRADSILTALQAGRPEDAFETSYLAIFDEPVHATVPPRGPARASPGEPRRASHAGHAPAPVRWLGARRAPMPRRDGLKPVQPTRRAMYW